MIAAEEHELHALAAPHDESGASRLSRAVLALVGAGVALDVWFVTFFGSTSALLGAPLVAAAAWRIVTAGRIRVPTAPIGLLCVFVAWCAASVTWAPALDDALIYLRTYGQLLAFALVMWQLLRTEADIRALAGGYLAGCALAVADAWSSFVAGRSVVAWEGAARFAASGYDPNDMALTVVLGIPVAAWFALTGTSRLRWAVVLYIPVSAIAIGLTGSRGGTLTAAVAVLASVAWAGRRSPLAGVWTASLAGLGVLAMITFVPEEAWTRILTIDSAAEGSFGGRTALWSAGLELAARHPVLGLGAGGYGRAAESIVGFRTVAHNTPLAVAVEFGAVGFLLFFGALAMGLLRASGSSPANRAFALTLALVWLVGTSSLSWETRKVTWLLFLLVAGLGALPARDEDAAAT